MTENSVVAAIMGGASYPAAEFPSMGAGVEGVIVSTKARQVREYDAVNPGAGKPKTYPGSNDPIMGVVIDLDTGQRQGEDPGIRRVYFDNRAQMTALRAALVAAGCLTRGPEIGGRLRVQWTGMDNTTTIPGKLWTDAYAPPAQAKVLATISNAVAPQPGFVGTPPSGFAPVGQPAPAPTHADQWGPPAQPAPTLGTALAALAPLNPAPVAQPAPVAAPTGRPQITATQAAAMANARVDISAFEIIPG